MKLQRDWITPITMGAFGLLAVTGALMFFHLDRGLNETAHEWLSWVLLGGVALVIGLATRFFTVSLLVLTVVAIASVNWPDNWSSLAELMQGYVFTDKGQGNFKLPVLFMGMLLPLLLLGPGKLSLDAWIRTALRRRCAGQASQHAAGEPMTCPKTP